MEEVHVVEDAALEHPGEEVVGAVDVLQTVLLFVAEELVVVAAKTWSACGGLGNGREASISTYTNDQASVPMTFTPSRYIAFSISRRNSW